MQDSYFVIEILNSVYKSSNWAFVNVLKIVVNHHPYYFLFAQFFS